MASSGVYDPDKPWQDQIDRDSVEVLLRRWLPEPLERCGFEALWTPKRLIQQLVEGNLDRELVIQVLARYPYLQIPPTPEVETFADVPAEGSFRDVARGARKLPSDKAFYKDVVELKHSPGLDSGTSL